MLCEKGRITKREIGAIRMQDEETYVQIATRCAEGFVDAVGPNRTLEKNITIRRLDSPPDMGRDGERKSGGGKSYGEKKFGDKKYGGKKFGGKPYAGKSKPGDGKPKRKFEQKHGDQPADSDAPKRSAGKAEREKTGAGSRPAGGKLGKPAYAKAQTGKPNRKKSKPGHG